MNKNVVLQQIFWEIFSARQNESDVLYLQDEDVREGEVREGAVDRTQKWCVVHLCTYPGQTEDCEPAIVPLVLEVVCVPPDQRHPQIRQADSRLAAAPAKQFIVSNLLMIHHTPHECQIYIYDFWVVASSTIFCVVLNSFRFKTVLVPKKLVQSTFEKLNIGLISHKQKQPPLNWGRWFTSSKNNDKSIWNKINTQ